MKRFYVAVCLFLACTIGWAQPTGFSQYTLENGLTVYLWEDHDQPDVHGWTMTRAGSYDEPAEATGLAHYLEHMLFKGTETIGALDWEKERPYYEQIIALYDELGRTTDSKAREAIQLKINEASIAAAQYTATDEFSNLVQSIGGEGLNAYTNYDQTCFMNQFPSYRMEQWMALYSDRLMNPVFRSFQAELENVFEEYNMYLDDNSTHVRNFIFSHLYEGLPYERDIIGLPEDLKNPHLRELIEFYNTWYVPNNMALVLVGDFDTEEAKPLIEKYFGRLEKKELPERTKYEWKTDFSKDQRYTARLGYTPELLIAFRGVAAGDKDETLIDYTTSLLSNSTGTGLMDRLTLDSKVMYAGAINDSRRTAGCLEVIAVPYMDPNTQQYESLTKTEKMVRACIDSLVEGRFTDELMEVVREEFYQDFDRQMEYPEMKIRLLEEAFIYQIPVKDLLREKEEIAAITREDVMRIAKQYLAVPSITFEIQEGAPHKDKLPKPKIKPLDSPHGQSAYWMEFQQMPAGHLVPKFVDLKDIDQDRFYEGVSVYCTPNVQNHIFTLRLKYGVGTYHMPLLEYASALMNMAGVKGNPGKTAGEFRTELARLGGKVNYSASENYLYVDIEGNEEHLEEIISLVNLHMLFCNFLSEDDRLINNIKGQVYSSRQVEQKNTDIVADAAEDYVLFGENSSYIRRPELQEVLELTASKLESEFHRALNYELEIHYAGALPADTVKGILYGHLPMAEHATLSLSPVERPRVLESVVNQRPGAGNPIAAVYFLEDKDMQQAKVSFYLEGDPYENTQAVPYMAFNEYFGGGFSGLVMNEIREKRSMAYTAYGFFRRPAVQKRKTYFMGYVGTQSDKVLDAVDVYMSLLDNMPMNEDNIESIRTILRQSLLSGKPTFRQKSQRMTDWFRMGYAIDPAALQIRQVQRLKFDDIRSFYTQHVQGRPVTIVIMGDPRQIDQKALKARYGKITKLSKSKLFSNDEIRY